MSDVRSEDFKENERVELSGYFDVHAHGNGFQLRRDGSFYSIIPIKKSRDEGFGQKIGWEVNSDKNRFDELHKALEFVFEEEGVSVSVEEIREYYGKEDEEAAN
jgi:hypothetical protein